MGLAIGFESVRSANSRLQTFDTAAANRLLEQLQDEAITFARQGSDAGQDPQVEERAYMRYVVQGWEIPVTLRTTLISPNDVAVLREDFVAAYTRFFGRPIDGLDIAVIS